MKNRVMLYRSHEMFYVFDDTAVYDSVDPDVDDAALVDIT
jgi:hypothetical protein